MAGYMIAAQAMMADGRLDQAEDLLQRHLPEAGVERAQGLMVLADLALARQDRSALARNAFNAAAELVNTGHVADAAIWLGAHLERLPDDVAARLLYRDVLHHLAALLSGQDDVQAQAFLQAAAGLELERSFLLSASPDAIAEWWRQLPRDAARPAVVREICTVIAMAEPHVRVLLYRLIEAEIPADLAPGIRAMVSMAALLGTQPDCLLHRRLVERWTIEQLRPAVAGLVPLVTPTGPQHAGERLRIGFIDLTYLCLMTNYREVLIAPSLRALADGPFDVFVYIYPWAEGHSVPDLAEILPPGVSGRWVDLSAVTADRIAVDRLDVLLMTNGYVQNLPAHIFAARPARRQALWMHTYGTYGPDLFDGTVIDEYSYNDLHARMSFEPAVGREGYPVLLGRPADAPPVRSLPARSNGFITFGVLARPDKLGPDCYRLWAPVLTALPDARLRIHGAGLMTDADLERMLAEMVVHGLPADRIDLAPFVDRHDDYLDAIGAIDVVLDSYPFTGGLTTFEALWQGIPVVSRKSETPIGCNGLIYLTEAGLPELVVASAAEYCRVALDLAGDLERLETLRFGLRDQMLRSRLMDVGNFRDRFGRAMRQLLALPAAGQALA